MPRSVTYLIVSFLLFAIGSPAKADEPIDIGGRRELFVDRFLVDQLSGGAELKLQKPTPREVVFVGDKPWEGNTGAYFTMFQDGDLFRMYYRGSNHDGARKPTHADLACYAESKDGIHWTKPELGLFEFNGSKKNNIVWDGPGGHNFTPFKDSNPACKPDARYKAMASSKKGLYAFQSADGIRWSLMQEPPVITKGAFDSQNLAFWDTEVKTYRCYHREFHNRKIRDIMTETSADFLTWTEPVFLKYPGVELDQLYTNAIRQYERAPHILIGFPTRYLNNAAQQVEPTFMSSRDGGTFHRFTEPVIPVSAPEDRAGNRSNYMCHGLLELPGSKNEMSVFGTEGYYEGPASRVRRFTYRTDGFVALHASKDGGELITKPFRFNGDKLTLNFLTAAKGKVQVELQDENRKPLENYQLSDCKPLQGDAIEQIVTWKNGADMRGLAGKVVRLRIELSEADLFSLRFAGSP